jgi:hypothetical protein
MRRLLLALALVVPALACTFDAPGRCSSSADCNGGLPCIQGICSLCRTTGDCNGWETCDASRTCVLAVGRCTQDLHCADWDRCDASNTCVLRPDHCPENLTCAAWEECDAARHCVLGKGRCSSAADCGTWATCNAGNACATNTSNGGDVLIWGTLADGYFNMRVVTAVNDPTRVEVGFDCNGSDSHSSAGVLSPSGRLVYPYSFSDELLQAYNDLRIYVGDEMVWHASASPPGWSLPSNPNANDPVAIYPSACPDDRRAWAMQAGTGSLMYACQNAVSWFDYYDESGAVPGLGGLVVLSWNANDYKLVAKNGAFLIVEPGGASKPVTGLPYVLALAFRATATGFRLAFDNPLSSDRELWEIGETGVGTKEGTYTYVTTGLTMMQPEVMDSDGNLYGQGTQEGPLARVVIRYPWAPNAIDAAPASVVYSEANAPAGANDFNAYPFVPFVLLDVSLLMTSP